MVKRLIAEMLYQEAKRLAYSIAYGGEPYLNHAEILRAHHELAVERHKV